MRGQLWGTLLLVALTLILELLVVASSDKAVSAAQSTTDTKSSAESLPKIPAASSDDEVPDSSQATTKEQFIKDVIKDVSDKWQVEFEKAGLDYVPPKVNIYEESSKPTACGYENSVYMGPMYCDLDLTIYYPLNSIVPRSGKRLIEYDDLTLAILAAHEVGHHAQNGLGISLAKAVGQVYGIQTELQADCYAGLWARSIYPGGHIEDQDLLTIMKTMMDLADLPGMSPMAVLMSGHGSADQRMSWFLRGYTSGEPAKCWTYS